MKMNWRELLRSWYREFPRQMLIYRRWVEDFESMIRIIEEKNGIDDIFVSVFSFPERDLDKPLIDRIVFDLDADVKKGEVNKEKLEEVYKEAKKLYYYLKSVGFDPIVVFSGSRGFHIYVFLDKPIKVSRQDLDKLTEFYSSYLGLKHLDKKVTKDYARLIRVPYTKHTKTGLYCVPINIEMSIDKILELARNPKEVPLVRKVSSSSFLISEIEKASIKTSTQKVELAPQVKFDGLYMSLPCINALFSYKLPAGKRRMKASKFIAIAYYLDHNGSMEGFEEVAKEFARIQNINHKLRFREVLGWKRGVYKLHQPPQWNCKEIRKYLLECKIPLKCENCELRKQMIQAKKLELKNKILESLKKLKKINLLLEVKRYLDNKVVGEDRLKVLLYLLILMKQSVVVKGEYASGKNTLVEAVLDLFPKDAVMTISAYTQKVLRYIESDRVPILYLKEVPPEVMSKAGQLKDFTFDIKLLMSDKVLEIWYVDRSEFGFESKKREVRVDCIVQTTPALEMPEDYKSRVWILSTDPSEEQTEQVLLWKARMRKVLEGEVELSLEELRNISWILFNVDIPVIIPYAETIARKIRVKSTKMRREIDKLFDMISAVTITNILERSWKTEDDRIVLISEIEDFLLSRKLFEEYLTLSVFDLEKRFTIAISKFNKIAREKTEVNVTDFQRELGIPRSKAKQLLEILRDRGLIERSEENEDVYYSSSITIFTDLFDEIKIEDLKKERDEFFSKYNLKKVSSKELIEYLDEKISESLRF